jgi:hypothetical protein
LASFEIEIEGNTQVIVIKDDITWGDTQNILKSCIDITDPKALKVNIQLYQQLVLQAAVEKNDFFDPLNLTKLNKLPSKTVAKIMAEVMKIYPLEILVKPWIVAMTGQESMESLMSSMSGVP